MLGQWDSQASVAVAGAVFGFRLLDRPRCGCVGNVAFLHDMVDMKLDEFTHMVVRSQSRNLGV